MDEREKQQEETSERNSMCLLYTNISSGNGHNISRVWVRYTIFFFLPFFNTFRMSERERRRADYMKRNYIKEDTHFSLLIHRVFIFARDEANERKRLTFISALFWWWWNPNAYGVCNVFFSSFLLWAFSIIELYLKFFFFEAKLLMIIFVVWPDEMVRINDRRSQQHIKSWYFLYINKTMMIAWNSAVATVTDVVADK